ncbi:MAG TPA: SpoIID/LytB domain-containing protein, partial [Candidatus Limnocylindria bacterium]|nr:SpoIID/LytB domain-containing protein [Candidatus Limnocylindria bacterium]
MRIWLARVLVMTVVFATMSMPAASSAPLAPLPPTIRVNISLLGTTYAKIGSTGSLTVTREDGGALYQGYANTVARRGVRRLADPSHALAGVRDPGERRSLLQLFREIRLRAQAEDIPIVTVPFEFAVEGDGSDPLAAPLFSAQQIVPLRYAASGGLLTFNGRAYRGTLDVTRDDEGDMIVVNEVGTAAYLASVIGSEEPTTWMPEALAAQAIAARTYLSRHLRQHENYDLEGDTRDQEYDGLAGESDSTVKAVERTTGMIATYRGSPIEALYSANAGGITEDSENVFANALPYLRSVPSPADDVAQASSWGHTSWEWKTEFTAPQLRSYIGARGIDVGDPQRIDLVRLTGAGRVLSAKIVGSNGIRDIGKDSSRYYFGLRSTLFTVETHPEETEYVEASNAERVRQLDFLGASVERTFTVSVKDPDRTSHALRVLGWQYRLPARFVFTGKGYGHGVGMSQWGAQGMALGGRSAEEILKHYYLG